MDAWLTFAGYEFVWFAAVSGAGRGTVWPGVAAAVLFGGWRLAVSRRLRLETGLLAASLLIGAALETCWVRTGLIRYASAWPLACSPAWLLALWAAFGLTIVPLFGYLYRRPGLAVILGALGGPLSYLAAARGWHAVFFPANRWPSLLALAIGWGAALPTLTTLARRTVEPRAAGSTE